MRKAFLTLLLLSFVFYTRSQQLPIDKGWKVRIGDAAGWEAVNLNENDWKPVDLTKNLEKQGYADYDGFSWYRLHIVIPSSLKSNFMLADSLKIVLNKVDDGDEFYLNGELVGVNGAKSGNIKPGRYGNRMYKLSIHDPRIHWNQENVIAVRIWDQGGEGGIYGDDFFMEATMAKDFITLDTQASFRFGKGNSVSKAVAMQSGNGYKGNFSGTFRVEIIDPETNKKIAGEARPATFTEKKPFYFTVSQTLPEKKSYEIIYSFTSAKTGERIEHREFTPYILTPASTASPKINGPAVYGARPGHAFLYKIPASGRKPIHYSATGLPDGLHLDVATGIIKGAVLNAGEYRVVLMAQNSAGKSTRNFTIKIGDRIGLTPVMGWNSWNVWGLSVSDTKVRESARAMVRHLGDYGWSYMNIDDGWESEDRLPDGRITGNEKFPDLKALSEYVHGLGLKIGIYSSPGPRTCGGYLGSYQHEDLDAESYGKWGIDYLKYDWCSYGQIKPSATGEELKAPYLLMRSSLDKAGRDIIYSLCQYGMGDVWKWGADIGANSWRTTGDITDTWESMAGIGFRQYIMSPYAGPGHYNDPDMLVVGKVGWGPKVRNSRLTPDEQYTHISLWSLLASPLLIGCDLNQLDEFTLNLLTNAEVLAINQDALGQQAHPLHKEANIQVWIKDLADGSKAVGLFNVSESYQKGSVDFGNAELKGYRKIRDLWRQKDLGTFEKNFSAKIPPHGVLLLKISK